MNYKSFINRILLKDSEARLFERYREKLLIIKQNIHSYMLTPKDAFIRFNKSGSGKLSYDEFNDFLINLCKIARD